MPAAIFVPIVLSGLTLLARRAGRFDEPFGTALCVVLSIAIFLGSVVGLFMATRLLRGEEEAGRWDLVVAGPTTRRGATLRAWQSRHKERKP